MKLYEHQYQALEKSKNYNRVAYYYDMGTGKTFIGSEKMRILGNPRNLLICQKSKVNDWINHFKIYYDSYKVYDLTKKNMILDYLNDEDLKIGVINYELSFRRKELNNIKDFTLILDESSMIQNESTKRSKFILKLNPKNVILLSGTPVSGKYEKIWSQMKLLNWNISKNEFWDNYINYRIWDGNGFPIKIVTGYKNIEDLKNQMRNHGALFLKAADILNLPEKIETKIMIKKSNYYRRFMNDSIVKFDDIELIGDYSLTKLLYARQLCSIYSKEKFDYLKDLIRSTEDRIIIFYNFQTEYERISLICQSLDKPISTINGNIKDLSNYENFQNSITLVQYQAGSMGLNLQKANKMIFYSPPLSVENYMQAHKRIHRIGQNKTCFYYYLITEDSVEENIYLNLKKGEDYTNRLFIEDDENVRKRLRK